MENGRKKKAETQKTKTPGNQFIIYYPCYNVTDGGFGEQS